MARLNNYFTMTTLFPKTPILYFKSNKKTCCEHKLIVFKTSKKKVTTLSIGTFYAHETKLKCNVCNCSYEADELKQLTPYRSRFGYDVIDYIGRAVFTRHCNEKAVQEELKQKNIAISLREIAYLSKKFIVYLALTHKGSSAKIKKYMQSQGGYILHLDGTCEGDSPHLISSIDELSSLVLNNIKVPTENQDAVTELLLQIKKSYGEPIAIVHDMGTAIINAVEDVFTGIPDYICHYHFLRDIGKDLFGLEYNNLYRYIKNYRVRTQLRTMARELKKIIDKDSEKLSCLHNYIVKQDSGISEINLSPLVSAYIIISWVLEYNCASNGFGFPFDRPYLDFCKRLQEAYPILKNLKGKIDKNKFTLKLKFICSFLKDPALNKSIDNMAQKLHWFEKLREAMRIAVADNAHGLNDEGSMDIKTIEQKVTKLRQNKKLQQLALINTAYEKMIKQIDKYWEKLFADPIKISTIDEIKAIQPQRTNNNMEQFFRNLKSGERKKSGTSSLNKFLKSMLADTPLIKNLSNQQYMKIILNGESTLAERFAKIDNKELRDAMKKTEQSNQKYPKGMKKIFKIPHLHQMLLMSSSFMQLEAG